MYTLSNQLNWLQQLQISLIEAYVQYQISPDNVGFGTTLSGEICLLLGEATKRAKEAYVQIDALNQTGDLRLGHAQIEFLTAIATLVNASDRVNTVEREKTEQAMPP